MVQEIDENRFRRHLGERFFRSGSLFCRFWGPTWLPDWPLWTDFRPTFVTFQPTVGAHVVFLRSRVLGEGAGLDLGRSRDPPGRNFGTIFGDSLRRVVHSWRPWFCSKFVHILPKVRSVCCPSLAFAPNSPCPSVGGAAVSAQRFK